ncbi:MAG: hypothetical protein RL693_1633 [Verrucomicrobiota bacterium]
MKSVLIPFALAALVSAAIANTAPTPVIVSAAMRSGTTFMDIVYRVNDPDDATVKVRALAFVDGVRSFAKVLRPVTFVEGTASKIGDAIASNTNHTLTWDVGADWNIDLGQVKFEILCRDARGLLAFDWITIPAAGGNPALTISRDAPSDASVLSALFWQYADGDTGLTLTNGILRGNTGTGNFVGVTLANGAVIQDYSAPFILKRMNLDPTSAAEVNYAAVSARAGLTETEEWHVSNRPYSGLSQIFAWGGVGDNYGQTTIPAGLTGITAIAAGMRHNLALKSDGTVVGWGSNDYDEITIPGALTGVTAVAAGWLYSVALNSDGTVLGWGYNGQGQTTIPAGLTGVTALSARGSHVLARKNDGTVVGWGDNSNGQITIPDGLTGVTAIAAGGTHSLALKSNGTVVGWGANFDGQATIPAGLTGVTAISAGGRHSLALKSNGTVVAWGDSMNGKTTIPAGLAGVTAISAGEDYSVALKNDGTLVAWGDDFYEETTIPAGLTGITAIAAGRWHGLALKVKAP